MASNNKTNPAEGEEAATGAAAVQVADTTSMDAAAHTIKDADARTLRIEYRDMKKAYGVLMAEMAQQGQQLAQERAQFQASLADLAQLTSNDDYDDVARNQLKTSILYNSYYY